MSENIENDLRNSKSDYLHTLTKSALSSIPLAGSAVSEIFNMIIAPPIEQRRDNWIKQIYNSLIELKNKVDSFDISKLKDNPVFISVFMQATQIAIKNHQSEKLAALQNAIVNSAKNIGIDETKQLIFLKLIDDLSVWHLKVLYYLQNPNKRFQERGISKPNLIMGSASVPLKTYYPELANEDAFLNLIIKDLYSAGLIGSQDLNGMMTESGLYANRTTKFGDEFLAYISE